MHVVYSRKEFDKALGTKTLPWMVGHASKGIITVFSPSVVEKVSPHSKETFPDTLKHEIAHIFSRLLSGHKALPRWISEGIAGYIAGQYNPNWRTKIGELNKLFYKKDWAKKPAFQFAFFAVKYLVENFGKRKFFRLMSKANMNSTLGEFNSVFKQIYKIPVSKFDRILKKELSR